MEEGLAGFVCLSIDVPLKVYHGKIIKVIEMLKCSTISKEKAHSNILQGCAYAKVTEHFLGKQIID